MIQNTVILINNLVFFMFKRYKFENNVTNNFSLKVVMLVFLMLPFLLSSFAWKKTKKCRIVCISFVPMLIGIIYLMKAHARPSWRYIYHNMIPIPKSYKIEIPRPKTCNIEIQRLKHNRIDKWSQDATLIPRHCFNGPKATTWRFQN